MSGLLLLIPFLATLSAVILYRQNGKKEILKLDLVQFLYAFILTPIIFVWLKTFVFFLIRKDIRAHISVANFFLIDTIFSIVFLYLFAFVVVHSLTKSFEMKRRNDPLHDFVQHSEYFHTWFAHIGFYGLAMILITILSALNLFLPLPLAPSFFAMPLIVAAGIISGAIGYYSLHQYYYGFHPYPQFAMKVGRYSFMTIMKILFALFFLIHIVLYFSLYPQFRVEHSFYWLSFFFFATLVVNAFFLQRSKRAQALFRKLKYSRRKKVAVQSAAAIH